MNLEPRQLEREKFMKKCQEETTKSDIFILQIVIRISVFMENKEESKGAHQVPWDVGNTFD